MVLVDVFTPLPLLRNIQAMDLKMYIQKMNF